MNSSTEHLESPQKIQSRQPNRIAHKSSTTKTSSPLHMMVWDDHHQIKKYLLSSQRRMSTLLRPVEGYINNYTYVQIIYRPVAKECPILQQHLRNPFEEEVCSTAYACKRKKLPWETLPNLLTQMQRVARMMVGDYASANCTEYSSPNQKPRRESSVYLI